MASFRTYDELRADVLERAEEELLLNQSEFFEDTDFITHPFPQLGPKTLVPYVDRALDRAYEDLLNRRAWLFARPERPYILRFQKPVTLNVHLWVADTISLSLSQPAPFNLLGWKAKPPGSNIVYRIVSNTFNDGIAARYVHIMEAPLTASPQSSFAETGFGPGILDQDCLFFKDEYILNVDLPFEPQTPTLPDPSRRVRQIVGLWLMDSTQQIDGPWSDERMREHYPNPIIGTWPPDCFSRPSENMLRFSQYPTQDGLAEMPYTIVPPQLSTTTQSSEILVPVQWRYVLTDGALAHLLDLKHDSRTPKWMGMFEAGIERMTQEDERIQMGLAGTRTRARKEPAWR